MTYKHLTIDEITMIESYCHQKVKPMTIAKRMCRAVQTIYTVVNFFKQSFSAVDYWNRYKENKKKCGRKRIELSASDSQYIKEKIAEDWPSDVIIGRQERMIPCSMRTLYRKFSNGEFDVQTLPMKGKRKPNGH